MSLSIDFTVRYSKTQEKIDTLDTRILTLVTNIETPAVSYNEARAVSMDYKTTMRTVVSMSETLRVEYIFLLAELDLDDEFRQSVIGSNDTMDIDCTGYPWINRTLRCSMNSGDITTSTMGIRGDYLRRSFDCLVLGDVA